MKDDRIRALAITNRTRHKDHPDSPTTKELGFKDFVTDVWTALFVRSETPEDIVAERAAAMQRVLVRDTAKASHATVPFEIMAFGPEEICMFHRGEYERFRRVAPAAGIQPR